MYLFGQSNCVVILKLTRGGGGGGGGVERTGVGN